MKNSSSLADEIIYSRRKSLAITILPGGRVVVRAPLHANPARITAFLQEKSSWIDQARAKMLNVEAQAEPYRYEEGRPIWFLGRQYLLRIVSRVKGGLIFDPDQGFLLEKGMQSRGAALLARFYKQETRRVVTDLVTKYVRLSLIHI